MKINPTNYNDYVYETVCFNNSNSVTQMTDYMNIMIEQAADILEFVSEAGAVGTAGKVVSGANKAVKGTANFIKKFIEFLKNMFGRFTEFITNAFKSNEKWLKQYKGDFANINYTNIGINMVPYWDGDPSKTAEMIQGSVQKVLNAYKLADGITTLSETELKNGLDSTDPEKFLEKYATGGNNVDGIKNLMRVGNKDGKDVVEIREGELKNKITSEFIPFLENSTSTINEARKSLNEVTKYLERVEKNINSRKDASVKEASSFLLMDIPLAVSEASSYSFVLEDAVDQAKNTAQANTPPPKPEVKKDGEKPGEKDSTSGNTKVEVVKTDTKQDETDKEISSYSTGVVKILRNYNKVVSVAISAQLTVIEERYSAYMNALKAVHKVGNTNHGRKGNTDEA